jgi:hypothetical protein
MRFGHRFLRWRPRTEAAGVRLNACIVSPQRLSVVGHFARGSARVDVRIGERGARMARRAADLCRSGAQAIEDGREVPGDHVGALTFDLGSMHEVQDLSIAKDADRW